MTRSRSRESVAAKPLGPIRVTESPLMKGKLITDFKQLSPGIVFQFIGKTDESSADDGEWLIKEKDGTSETSFPGECIKPIHPHRCRKTARVAPDILIHGTVCFVGWFEQPKVQPSKIERKPEPFKRHPDCKQKHVYMVMCKECEFWMMASQKPWYSAEEDDELSKIRRNTVPSLPPLNTGRGSAIWGSWNGRIPR